MSSITINSVVFEISIQLFSVITNDVINVFLDQDQVYTVMNLNHLYPNLYLNPKILMFCFSAINIFTSLLLIVYCPTATGIKYIFILLMQKWYFVSNSYLALFWRHTLPFSVFWLLFSRCFLLRDENPDPDSVGSVDFWPAGSGSSSLFLLKTIVV